MPRRKILGIAFFSVFLFAGGIVHAMTSTNYIVNWDSVNSGGADNSTSTNYVLKDTIGGQATGYSSSTNYQLRAGYRTGDMDLATLNFSIHTENSSVKSLYTTFNSLANTVVVASTSGFSVGDMIAAVEQVGLGEKAAIGRIASIVGSTISVDKWDGQTGTMVISPSGATSFVFRLDGSTVSFGNLTGPTTATSLTGTRVTTNAVNGFTVYVQTNGGLTTGVTAITNVSDGIVSSGQEEYGWGVQGATATSTPFDQPFAVSATPIQQSTTFVNSEGVVLIYKLSVISSTTAGAYAQTVSYTATANF